MPALFCLIIKIRGKAAKVGRCEVRRQRKVVDGLERTVGTPIVDDVTSLIVIDIRMTAKLGK